MMFKKTTDRPIDFGNPPPLATVEEVGEMLRRSRSSILRDIKSGRLKSIKIGSSRRVVVASVIALIEAKAAA